MCHVRQRSLACVAAHIRDTGYARQRTDYARACA